MKKENKKNIVFRRIGGTIVPITIAANSTRVSYGTIVTTDKNIKSISRPRFFKKGKRLSSFIGNKKIASATLRTKNLFGERVTFIDSFRGAGRSLMSAFNNESVMSKTSSISGFVASRDNIKFTDRNNGSFFSFKARGGKLIKISVTKTGANRILINVDKGKSKTLLVNSFKNTGKIMGKVSRGSVASKLALSMLGVASINEIFLRWRNK